MFAKQLHIGEAPPLTHIHLASEKTRIAAGGWLIVLLAGQLSSRDIICRSSTTLQVSAIISKVEKRSSEFACFDCKHEVVLLIAVKTVTTAARITSQFLAWQAQP